MADGIRLTTCQEMLVDHAFTLPLALFWPDRRIRPASGRPSRSASTRCRQPLPSAARCYSLGQAIGRAVASWPGDERVVVFGTGGLSHQLDGKRAGFINKTFDMMFMDKPRRTIPRG